MENGTFIDPRIVFFDSIAEAWDGWHDLDLLAEKLNTEFDGFGIQSCETVLDVGCGTGNLTRVLLRRLDSEGRLIALDISPVMLERAREKIGDPRVTWVQASAERIPVADASCDRILCFSAWPHFEDQQAVVREFQRVLKPGGCIHIFHFISRDEVNRIHGEAHPSVSADLLAPVREVASLFERSGFTVLSLADDAYRYSLNLRKGKCL